MIASKNRVEEMKKMLLAALLTLSSMHAYAKCAIDIRYTDSVSKAVYEKDGALPKNFADVCKKLAAANAGLVITGIASVHPVASLTASVVQVRDMKTGIITSSGSGVAASSDRQPTTAGVNNMLYSTINLAIEYLDIDSAIKGLEELRKHLK